MEISPCCRIGVVLSMYHREGKKRNKNKTNSNEKKSFKIYPLETSQTRENTNKGFVCNTVAVRLFTSTDYKKCHLWGTRRAACMQTWRHVWGKLPNDKLLQEWPCKESWGTLISSFLSNIWRASLYLVQNLITKATVYYSIVFLQQTGTETWVRANVSLVNDFKVTRNVCFCPRSQWATARQVYLFFCNLSMILSRTRLASQLGKFLMS